jgi:hypothetical protein
MLTNVGLALLNIVLSQLRWKLTWGDTQFKLLVFIFDVDLEKIFDLHINEKLQKVKKSITH